MARAEDENMMDGAVLMLMLMLDGGWRMADGLRYRFGLQKTKRKNGWLVGLDWDGA